jgi:FkbM family methyltransferase
MRSYAQRGEDLALWKLLDPQEPGFYVDVGAGNPVLDSVTMMFYEAGWHGINIEPQTVLCRMLQDRRPRDINISTAVSDFVGYAELSSYQDRWGWATIDPATRTRHGQSGLVPDLSIVLVTTLDAILFANAPGQDIDFLKIDAEGSEKAILRGANLSTWMPKVIVIEAVDPGGTRPCHEDWEPLVLSAGYQFDHFDGVNRFYLRSRLEGGGVASAGGGLTDSQGG